MLSLARSEPWMSITSKTGKREPALASQGQAVSSLQLLVHVRLRHIPPDSCLLPPPAAAAGAVDKQPPRPRAI